MFQQYKVHDLYKIRIHFQIKFQQYKVHDLYKIWIVERNEDVVSSDPLLSE